MTVTAAADMPKGPQGQKRKRLWDIGDIVKLIEEWESADEPQTRVNAIPDLNERAGH
jgi:hypothetical protein